MTRSQYLHMTKGKPSAVGEVGNLNISPCVQMDGVARRASTPYQSLVYLIFNPTATWHFFNDNWWAPIPSKYDSFPYPGEATALLIGPLS